ESDTVAHHFWRFHDPRSPRHAPSPFAGAIARVYEALDRAVGALLAAAPPDAAVAIVSDHGSGGASDRVVHLNRRLAECGLLGFRRASRGRLAGLVRAAALRAVPRRLQGALVRRAPAAAGRLEGLHRLAGIEWSRTLAYAEELDYHPSVWLDGYSPSGLRSVGRGPALRRLAPAEHGGGKGRGMNGAHRRDGLFILAGAGVRRAGELGPADIVDVAPTVLALAGEPVPAGLDGRPIAAALDAEPRSAPDSLADTAPALRPFDDDETRD